MKIAFLMIAVTAVFIPACIQESPALVIHSSSGNYLVRVEVVEKPADLERGLMNRTYLEEDSGMLFVFQQDKAWTFWMKNTLIPLDIIFISSDMKIVDMTTMQPCRADPCPSYTSKQPALYVLELNAGYASRHNITVGDRISSEVITLRK